MKYRFSRLFLHISDNEVQVVEIKVIHTEC